MSCPPAACLASVQRSSPRTSCVLCSGFTCGQLTWSPTFFYRFLASNLERRETTPGSGSDPLRSTQILLVLLLGKAWTSSLCFKLGCVNQKPTMASRSTPTIPREKIWLSPRQSLEKKDWWGEWKMNRGRSPAIANLACCSFLSLCSNPSSKWKSSTAQRGLGATRASTAMRNPQKRAVVDTLSRLTLRSSGGTGSLRPSATEPTIARGSASSCTCSSTHMHTLLTRPIRGAQRGPAAHPPRCRPSTCSTLTARNRSSMERSRLWWLTTVAAPEETLQVTRTFNHREKKTKFVEKKKTKPKQTNNRSWQKKIHTSLNSHKFASYNYVILAGLKASPIKPCQIELCPEPSLQGIFSVWLYFEKHELADSAVMDCPSPSPSFFANSLLWFVPNSMLGELLSCHVCVLIWLEIDFFGSVWWLRARQRQFNSAMHKSLFYLGNRLGISRVLCHTWCDWW